MDYCFSILDNIYSIDCYILIVRISDFENNLGYFSPKYLKLSMIK